jgi:DNA-binding Lrp family transcriptional regulator
MKQKLLALLTKDPRISTSSLAKILGISEKRVQAEIDKFLKTGEIVGFATVLNSNVKNEITAMVEVRVMTQRGKGFDEVAERIAKFPEVVNVYLISGSHDLNLLVKGKSLADLANFINKKVAVLENVTGTTTHFLLKKYKEDGLVFGEKREDRRLKVSA